jgi:hypothetical protein
MSRAETKRNLRVLYREDDLSDRDLILSDFTLPFFKGTEALALAKAAPPEVPFDRMTSSAGGQLIISIVRRAIDDT